MPTLRSTPRTIRGHVEEAVNRHRRLVAAPPDFVGVGAQKSGTSWWWTLIKKHPSVWHPISTPKGLHFFDDLESTAPDDLDPATYHRLFPRPSGLLAGEWTPRYLFDPWTVPLLAAVAPEARILVLLRDPIERFLSGRAHELRPLSDPRESDLREIDRSGFARGLYADQLDRLFAHFDRDRVLVLQYERVCVDTAAELRRTYRFLELDDRRLPRSLHRRVNQTKWTRAELAKAEYTELAERYRPQLERLEHLLPDFDFSLWPSARER